MSLAVETLLKENIALRAERVKRAEKSDEKEIATPPDEMVRLKIELAQARVDLLREQEQ